MWAARGWGRGWFVEEPTDLIPVIGNPPASQNKQNSLNNEESHNNQKVSPSSVSLATRVGTLFATAALGRVPDAISHSGITRLLVAEVAHVVVGVGCLKIWKVLKFSLWS